MMYAPAWIGGVVAVRAEGGALSVSAGASKRGTSASGSHAPPSIRTCANTPTTPADSITGTARSTATRPWESGTLTAARCP